MKANADVKGLTYCVLQCLQLAGLHESLALYPEFAPRFSRGLRGELSYNLGAGGVSAEVRVLGMCVERLGFQGANELNKVGGTKRDLWACVKVSLPRAGVYTHCFHFAVLILFLIYLMYLCVLCKFVCAPCV